MVSFRDREERRMIALREDLFGDAGQGVYADLPREFVLKHAERNLWEGIRQDAIDYFRRNGIGWHKTQSGAITGHLLSSQIACVNHLYSLRQRSDLATALLKKIDLDIVAAEIIDDGLVEFEFIGKKRRLKERAFSRGANCTSVDAAMIGRTKAGERRLFLIEWKYVESYRAEDKYIPARAEVYDDLITGIDTPFVPCEPRTFYFEPFYQLMRQTLLGTLLAKHGDYGCSSYRHIHVAPEQNREFHTRMTAPDIARQTVSGAWSGMLKQPDRFLSTTPSEFLRPVEQSRDTKALCAYLRQRYWSAI